MHSIPPPSTPHRVTGSLLVREVQHKMAGTRVGFIQINYNVGGGGGGGDLVKSYAVEESYLPAFSPRFKSIKTALSRT